MLWDSTLVELDSSHCDAIILILILLAISQLNFLVRMLMDKGLWYKELVSS